jgi:ribosomal protein S18 acetylase RimI-like enzyme
MIEIRGMEPGDLAFIYSSWLRGLRFGNAYFEQMDSDAYYASKKEEITAVLCQPDVSVRVACASDDREVILGYLVARVADEASVVWVWVRPAIRRQSVATQLCHGLRVRFAENTTGIGAEIIKRKGFILRPTVIQWNNKE